MGKSADPFQPTVVSSALVQMTSDVSVIESCLNSKGFGSGKDMAYFVIQHCARRTLPYGRWTCVDGREVLFNREYQPILQRYVGALSHCDHSEWADHDEWVDTIVKTEYFYDDLTAPMRYLVKHLGRESLDAEEAKACKKALLICLDKLKEFTPEERNSVNRRYSVRNS